LINKKLRNRLYGDKPECFIPLKSNSGDDVPFFCLCNRLGTYDSNVIEKSIKMVNYMIKHNKYNPEKLNQIKNKLTHYMNRYNKDIPKPHRSIGNNMRFKRRLKNIKKYINDINNY
jgi:hypothetical protein